MCNSQVERLGSITWPSRTRHCNPARTSQTKRTQANAHATTHQQIQASLPRLAASHAVGSECPAFRQERNHQRPSELELSHHAITSAKRGYKHKERMSASGKDLRARPVSKRRAAVARTCWISDHQPGKPMHDPCAAHTRDVVRGLQSLL